MSKRIATFTDSDYVFMRRALVLAEKGKGTTAPNPMVGAVVVKNGKIIAEAYHHQAGQPHAEVLALRKCNKNDLRGATLYVTLEPCCHLNKRTPPCTAYLLEKGVTSLVIAQKDPNPLVSGKGIAFLKKHGVTVRAGLLAQEAQELNEVFLTNMKFGRPFIVLKMAASLEGKIATKNGGSKWLTGEDARQYVHELRNSYDAILTSSRTVKNDDPHLGVRMVKGKDPLRIIVDRKLTTVCKAKVYRDANVLVITTPLASSKKITEFRKKEIALKSYPVAFTWENIFKDLYKEKGVTSIMVEAGGTLAASLMKEKMVDKMVLFYAPVFLGAEGINVLGDLEIKKVADGKRFVLMAHRLFKHDIMLELYPTRP